MKRFVSWAAVSSLPQAKKVSLDEQRKTNMAHIEKWGGVLVADLVVRGESRSVLFEEACAKMSAYAKLRDLIAQKAFDVLIYFDTTRLGRKQSLTMTIFDLCADAGIVCYETESPPVSLEFSEESFDVHLIRAIKSVSAQEETRKTQKRRRMGLLERVRKGEHPATPPYGYRKVHDIHGKTHTEVVPEQAEVVRLVFRLLLENGLGRREIAVYLNGIGVAPPQGDRWNGNMVVRFYRCVWRYTGVVEWGKGTDDHLKATALYPAIISTETAQAVEAETQRRSSAPRTLSSGGRFSGVARCLACGANLHYHSRAQDRHRRASYCCAQRCSGSHVGEHKLVAAIRETIDRIRSVTNLDELVADQPDPTIPLEADADKVKLALSEVAAQRQQLLRSYMRRTLEETEYETMMAELEAQRKVLQAELERIDQRRLSVESHTERKERLAQVAEVGYLLLDDPNPRTAAAWLRQNFRLVVAQNEVVGVEVCPQP